MRIAIRCQDSCVQLHVIWAVRYLDLLSPAMAVAATVGLRADSRAALLASAVGEEQRLERRNASTYHTHVGLDGRPYPDVEPLPRGIVCLEKSVMDPVCAEAACHDDDAADAEEGDKANTLWHGEREAEQSRNWQRVDHEIGQDVDDGLDDERRALSNAISMIGCKLPVALDGTAIVSIELRQYDRYEVTYMHCTQRATRKTMKAAKTRAKVAQTNLRKSDFSGAMRKYDTSIDILTKLEASTKSV
jgi:hypothetical protein